MSDYKATDVAARTLIFDSECRPLSYLSGDYTTGEVTAIAWKWLDDPNGPISVPECEVLSQAPGSLESMLLKFVAAWESADLAVGHYIKGHDLPVINGALLEQNIRPLEPKLVQDTKSDLLVSRYVSLSQESLSAMLGLDQEKLHMTQADWRRSNRLDSEGIAVTRKRVMDDVLQNEALYGRLRLLGWLSPPKQWDARSAKSFRYRP